MGIEMIDELVEWTFFDGSTSFDNNISEQKLDARRRLEAKFEEQRLLKEIQEFDFE